MVDAEHFISTRLWSEQEMPKDLEFLLYLVNLVLVQDLKLVLLRLLTLLMPLIANSLHGHIGNLKGLETSQLQAHPQKVFMI